MSPGSSLLLASIALTLALALAPVPLLLLLLLLPLASNGFVQKCQVIHLFSRSGASLSLFILETSYFFRTTTTKSWFIVVVVVVLKMKMKRLQIKQLTQ